MCRVLKCFCLGYSSQRPWERIALPCIHLRGKSVRVNYLNLVASYLNAAGQLNLAVGREVIL